MRLSTKYYFFTFTNYIMQIDLKNHCIIIGSSEWGKDSHYYITGLVSKNIKMLSVIIVLSHLYC